MSVDRLLRQDQVRRDRVVRLAGREQPKHLQLTRGQAVRLRVRLAARQALDPAQVRCRAEFTEDPAGRRKLQRRGLFVPKRPAAERNKYAYPCGFVRRIESPPDAPGAAQSPESAPGVGFGEKDGTQ